MKRLLILLSLFSVYFSQASEQTIHADHDEKKHDYLQWKKRIRNCSIFEFIDELPKELALKIKEFYFGKKDTARKNANGEVTHTLDTFDPHAMLYPLLNEKLEKASSLSELQKIYAEIIKEATRCKKHKISFDLVSLKEEFKKSQKKIISNLSRLIKSQRSISLKPALKDEIITTKNLLSIFTKYPILLDLGFAKTIIKNITDPHDLNTLLENAVYNGKTNATQVLLDQGVDVNFSIHTNNLTYLHLAAGQGFERIVKLLIEYGADIDSKTTDEGITPLFAATSMAHDSYIVELLIAHGADVNSTAWNGRTCLFMAALNGNIQIAQLLLKNGADINAVDNCKMSPLLASICSMQSEFAQFLIDQGANINIPNDTDKKMPIHVAALYGLNDVVESLIAHGASPSAQSTGSSQTPLFLAAFGGHNDAIKTLLKHNAPVDDVSQDWTALLAAARYGHTQAAQTLLAHGANASFIAKDGYSPLHAAAKWGHTEIVKMLLNYGASKTLPVKDDLGKTPLEWALANGHTEIVTLLQT